MNSQNPTFSSMRYLFPLSFAWPGVALKTFLFCVDRSSKKIFPGPFLVQSTWDTGSMSDSGGVTHCQTRLPPQSLPLWSHLDFLLFFLLYVFLYKCIFDGILVNDVSIWIICNTVIGLFCKKRKKKRKVKKEKKRTNWVL